MIARLVLITALAAFCASEVYNQKSLLLRYSFDTLPPTDAGASARGAATVLGAPQATTGRIGGGARFFNGTTPDAYLAGQWTLAAPATITAWFSVDNNALTAANPNDLYMKVLSTKENWNSAQGIELQYNVGQKQWTVVLPGAGGFLDYTNPVQYVANEFHHIAVTVTAQTVTLYIDNQSVATKAVTTPLTANAQADKQPSVGASVTGGAVNAGGAWRGVLDELRVYNYALNSTEVGTVYSNQDLATTSSTSTSSTSSSSASRSSSGPSSSTPLPSSTSDIPADTNQRPQNAAGINVPACVAVVVAAVAVVMI